MRTALLIETRKGKSTVVAGPTPDVAALKARYKATLREIHTEKFNTLEHIEVWTSDSGRVKRAKISDLDRQRAATATAPKPEKTPETAPPNPAES